MPFIHSGEVRLWVEEAGAGPPILFLHELASDARQWAGQVAAFSARHRCVAPYARGYPPSDVPEADDAYLYDRFAADIDAVVSGLSLDRPILVGWSMGAYAALVHALRHPGRARALVLAGVGSGSPPDDVEGFRADMAALADVYLADGAEAGADAIAAADNRQAFRRDRPEAWAAWLADLESHLAEGMARVCRNYQGRRPSLLEFAPELARLAIPTLIIVGDEDGPCLGISRTLADLIPGAKLVVMEGVGHAPNLERPEAFDAEVMMFIEASSLLP